MFYKPIMSEKDPVDIEDAKSGYPGAFNFSATGWAKAKWQNVTMWLGEYTLTAKEYRGRPVYKRGTSDFLYFLESGVWGVGRPVGDNKPAMRSKTACRPDLCIWQYSDAYMGGPPYKDGEITVKLKY